MTPEQRLLRGMLDERKVYEAWKRFGVDSDLSSTGRLIGRLVGEFYGADPAVQRCDAAVICERAARTVPNPKHAEAVERAIRDLPPVGSPANVIADIHAIRRDAIGAEIAVAIPNGVAADKVFELMQQYQAVPLDGTGQVDEAADFIDGSDTSWLDTVDVDQKNLIALRPKSLNDRIDGGALPGHHILVFARPEAGKTLFTINMCAGFLKQGHNVLYIGNEEPLKAVRLRFTQRLIRQPKATVLGQATKVRAALEQQQGKYWLADTRSFPAVERLVESLQPSILVLDQLRNMDIKNDSRTGQLEAAASRARAIGKKYNLLVVSVTQAGNSASDKIYLDMSDVDSSKTGIPAAVDLMIGVGGNAAMEAAGTLGISLPKNKLSGNHDQFFVQYDKRTGVIT